MVGCQSASPLPCSGRHLSAASPLPATRCLVFAATFDFGKVDAIGHLMIIAILLLEFADPGREQPYCCAAAPLADGTALLAVIFLYAGSHALYYGSLPAALAPFASGAALALLAASFLYLGGVAHGLLRPIRRRLLILLIRWDERDGAGDILTAQRLQGLATQRSTPRSERLAAQHAHG